MFDTVLIANRGEIAVRDHPHAPAAGHPLGRRLQRRRRRTPGTSARPTSRSHGRRRDISISRRSWRPPRRPGRRPCTPATASSPRTPAFARRCAEAGLVFVGPPPEAIEAMGDKIRAKATVVGGRGARCVPGGAEPDDDLVRLLPWIGFPALIKPSAGGGGKGMVLVRSAAELPDALESARRTAARRVRRRHAADRAYVENPRHIEIQVLADTHGNVVHLGERECSLQRRHQKIIEEAPSPAARRGDPGARWAPRRSRPPGGRLRRRRARSSSSSHGADRRRTTSWR